MHRIRVPVYRYIHRAIETTNTQGSVVRVGGPMHRIRVPIYRYIHRATETTNTQGRRLLFIRCNRSSYCGSGFEYFPLSTGQHLRWCSKDRKKRFDRPCGSTRVGKKFTGFRRSKLDTLFDSASRTTNISDETYDEPLKESRCLSLKNNNNKQTIDNIIFYNYYTYVSCL